MRSFTVYLAIGGLLVIIGVYLVLPDWPTTYNFTNDILPGKSQGYDVPISSEGRISGDFRENTQRPISFYMFDQQQYTAFQTARGIPDALFTLTEVSSGSYSVSVRAPGAYHIVFVHGVALEQSTQQINVRIVRDGTNTLILGVGLAVTFAGTILVAVGYEARRTSHLQPWSLGN